MPDAPEKHEREPLGTLFARLVDNVTALFRAELNLYRQTALRRVAQAKLPVILIVTAVLLAQSSVTTILVGFAFGLAVLIGPVGGGLVVGLVGLALCGLLVRVALARLGAALGEASEKDAQAIAEKVVEEKVAEKLAA